MWRPSFVFFIDIRVPSDVLYTNSVQIWLENVRDINEGVLNKTFMSQLSNVSYIYRNDNLNTVTVENNLYTTIN